jgi:hypothetical protein
MRKMGRIVIIASMVFIISAACSFTSILQQPTPTQTQTFTPKPTKTATPTRTQTPTDTPTATPTSTPMPTDDPYVEIILNNDTGDMVCAVFAYTDEETGTLDNLLEDMIMFAGSSKTIALLPGKYNFEVWDCQGNRLHNLYGFVIEEDFEWALSEVPENYVYEGQQSLILINERAWDICELYIRPGDSEDWGDNLFHPEANYYLAAGSTLIEPLKSGLFDFKLVYCDGTLASTLDDVDVPEDQDMTWTLTP